MTLDQLASRFCDLAGLDSDSCRRDASAIPFVSYRFQSDPHGDGNDGCGHMGARDDSTLLSWFGAEDAPEIEYYLGGIWFGYYAPSSGAQFVVAQIISSDDGLVGWLISDGDGIHCTHVDGDSEQIFPTEIYARTLPGGEFGEETGQ